MTRSGATSNVAVLGALATFATLSLVALAPEAAAAAPPTVWDQSRFIAALELPITTHIRADDFVVASPTYLLAADVWLADQVAGNNGVLDGFSGALYWAVYTSAGTTPGTPILTGRAVAVVQTDTGLQTTDNNDMVRVHFELEPAVPLAPGTYWFALHEGVWGTSDGSPLDWLSAFGDAGNVGVLVANSATPAGWSQTSDPALVLYGGPLIWNSFAAGVPASDGLDASYPGSGRRLLQRPTDESRLGRCVDRRQRRERQRRPRQLQRNPRLGDLLGRRSRSRHLARQRLGSRAPPRRQRLPGAFRWRRLPRADPSRQSLQPGAECRHFLLVCAARRPLGLRHRRLAHLVEPRALCPGRPFPIRRCHPHAFGLEPELSRRRIRPLWRARLRLGLRSQRHLRLVERRRPNCP